ncbi:MAG TPA: GDSL-type esterase/lipase family protein [Pseudolabrys sp.]|nr:GDSL-type esterase/lipase family protein [Pseudolabrys sp.]
MWERSFRSVAVLACVMVTLGGVAAAKTINILAIGASNTAGKGVSDSEAWPAVLEGMLKHKGYDAHVTVRAANGLTSTQIVSYTNSIPAGTQVVIFDAGGSNDRKRNVSLAQSAANKAEIVRRIRAHGAVAIKVPYGNGHRGGYPRQADGIHFTPAGHRMIAAKLMARVIAATRR